MTATANDQMSGRAVAGEELFQSLAHFVVVHNGQSPERAERIGHVDSFQPPLSMIRRDAVAS